ncbi:MAG TPA: putative Ig domain-containing protein [Phycisphaerae bacterium]|nr:putative Ig domain-containing protein [Phycisphaerae bacterium]HRY70031.1 putative Ig domain-containing protein [Phycisphaerae bacterium]HSA27307.1 putative Ig domain-containing protein [Phycisphaerae bacterium]
MKVKNARWAVAAATACGLVCALLPQRAYSQPSPSEFQPLTATLTLLDENGSPLTPMCVRAVNHEYGFRQEATTDANARAVLQVMPGKWSFYATPTFDGLWSHPGKGYLLVRPNEAFNSSSRSLTLQPSTVVQVNLVSSVFDFKARENYLGFVVEPYGKFLDARQAGVTGNDSLTLHTNPGLIAVAFVASPRSSGDLLAFIQAAMPLSSPFAIEVSATNSALLEVSAQNASGDPTDYHVQLYTYDLSWAWSPFIMDVPAHITRMRVSPNQFHLIRAVDALDEFSARWRLGLHPIVIRPTAGQVLSLSMGGSLATAPVRTTPRAAAGFSPTCQIMPQLRDAYGNILMAVYEFGGDEVKPVISVHHGSGDPSPFEVYGCLAAKRLEEFNRTEKPTYDISWDFGPWGAGAISGDLYGQEERRMAIDETASLLSQAPRMDRDYRRAKVETYQELADAMQGLMGVPVDTKMGVISNIAHAGFEDEVLHGFKLENGIEIDTPTGWPQGSGYIDHEAGHGRIHKPPCRFFAVGTYAEAYATLLGVQARARLFGGDEYLKYQLGAHDLFLRHRHGAPLTTDGDYIETMQFITHYICTHYGWTPHRRMILEWSNAFRGIRAALGGAGYSEIEQFTVVYSWLCGGNLGPLFEAAGFPVSSARVEAGLAMLQANLAAGGEVCVSVGINAVDAPQTSIPLELVACPSPGVSDIKATLSYDSSTATVEGVSKRDLTDSAAWSLTADTSTPGTIQIHLFGTVPVAGAGSIAQIKLRLLPNASGVLSFALSDTQADGSPVSAVDGTLSVPTTPLIGPFPNLPDARRGRPYSTSLWAVGGTPPYTWAVVEDALPPELTLDAASGKIHGQCPQEGEYLFRIGVTDQAHAVTHRWFTVSSMPPPAPGDFNLDGDVDADDLAVFASCMTGPEIPHNGTPDCLSADFDTDSDVDQSDFGVFQRCYSGANKPADPNCAD